MRKLLPLLVLVAAAMPACAGEEPGAKGTAAVAERDAKTTLPAQRRDPEQREGESASAGASLPAPERTVALPPRGPTDLGREAEKEDEEFRKRQKLDAAQK